MYEWLEQNVGTKHGSMVKAQKRKPSANLTARIALVKETARS